MEQYAGLDVSLDSASVCIVDAQGKIVKEAKVACEPEVLIAWFAAHGTPMARIGLEAGPLSQWLFAEMKAAGWACRKLWRRPQDGPWRPQFHALLTSGRPKQTASSRFCSRTVHAPAKPKPLRSHSMASKPRMVRRAVWKA